jgi:murein DD-endopeptidase MepM/ murein hydrolase activator NlpD
MVLLTVAAAATWTGETQNFAEATANDLAESQRTVVQLLDSVQILAALAERAKYLPPKDMIMPVAGHISSRFSSSRLHPILEIFRAHRGVDVSAPMGTKIVAPADGRVRYVGWRIGYGLTVEVSHSGNIMTLYAHCRTSLVREGQVVKAGQIIATVGSSGLSTGPHVHFEVLDRGKSVDPIKFLASTRAATRVDAGAGAPIKAEGRPMGL